MSKPLAQRSLAVLIGLYIVGSAVSQSLMSAAATLLCAWTMIDLCLRHYSRRLQNPYALLFGALYVFLGLGLLAWRLTHAHPIEWNALELLPLILIAFWPLAWSESERSSFIEQGRYWEGALVAGSLAYALSSGRAVYEGFVVGRMATAWMKNPIYLAYNLLFALVLLGLALPRVSRRWRGPGIALYVLMLLGIFATNSRMALLVAALMSFGLLGRWLWRYLPRTLSVGLLAVFVAVGVWEYQSKPYVRQRVASALDLSDLSWRGRLQAWDHNLGIIREHPLLGVGPKQNGLYTRDLAPEWQALWGSDVVIFAHSIYLQLLAEVGLIGFLLFGGSLVCLFRKRPLTRPLLITLLLGGLTENILSNSKPLHAVIMTLLVAGLVSPERLNRNERSA